MVDGLLAPLPKGEWNDCHNLGLCWDSNSGPAACNPWQANALSRSATSTLIFLVWLSRCVSNYKFRDSRTTTKARSVGEIQTLKLVRKKISRCGVKNCVFGWIGLKFDFIILHEFVFKLMLIIHGSCWVAGSLSKDRVWYQLLLLQSSTLPRGQTAPLSHSVVAF